MRCRASCVPAPFSPLPSSPKAAARMDGDAWVAENDPGTTATLEATGLEPATEYVGHLHAQPCSRDDVGTHFAFDSDGLQNRRT
jgi:hypothetical protein